MQMRVFSAAAVLGVVVCASGSAGAKLGNVAYQQADLGVTLASFNETTFTGGPGGSNTVLMLREYMLVMGSHDSGVPDGPLHVFDVSNPKAPVLKKRFTSAETGQLRELHAMPLAVIDGKDILVFPTVTGLQFFDFTDPLNPLALGAVTLTGVSGGDYDNAAWMATWAWPYVYVGGTGNGVYVVDARDPENPVALPRIEQADAGGFRVGPCYAAGNYIIASGMDTTPTEVSVIDAGDPEAPFLLTKGSAPAPMYSALVIGDRVYGSGEGGNYSFFKWNKDTVEPIGGALKLGSDKGGYCTYQDAFIFCGQSSEGFRKIDVSDEANFHEVFQANIDAAGADSDFATVLGNLVYLGNDHGSGAGLFAHTMAPDTTPPKFLKAYPENGDLMQPLTSRITLFFSDEIDLDTMTADNIIVRPVDGAPVDGVFSHSSFNAISFGAKEPLLADTTYEVVVLKDGLKDLAQNAIGEETVTRFSTGDTIVEPMGGGGSSGMAGSGGSMAGSSSAGSPPSSSGSGGAPPSSAGSTSTEAGTNGATPPVGTTPQEGGGCGCNIPGQSSNNAGLALLGLAALGSALRIGRRAAKRGTIRS